MILFLFHRFASPFSSPLLVFLGHRGYFVAFLGCKSLFLPDMETPPLWLLACGLKRFCSRLTGHAGTVCLAPAPHGAECAMAAKFQHHVQPVRSGQSNRVAGDAGQRRAKESRGRIWRDPVIAKLGQADASEPSSRIGISRGKFSINGNCLMLTKNDGTSLTKLFYRQSIIFRKNVLQAYFQLQQHRFQLVQGEMMFAVINAEESLV